MNADYQFSAENFIKLMIKTQKYLHSENSMYIFEQQINQSQVNNIGKTLHDLFIDFKHSTTSIFLLYHVFQKNKGIKGYVNDLPPKSFHNYAKKVVSESTDLMEFLPIEEFAKRCSLIDCKKPYFNIFALNTLPTFFQFLLTDESISNYMQFLNNFGNDQFRFCQFSRFIFTHPFFVHFIHEAFHPILQPYADSKSPIPDPEMVVNQLYKSWIENIVQCPNFAQNVLLAYKKAYGEPCDLLINSFIKYFVRIPQMFAAIDYYQVYLPDDMFLCLEEPMKNKATDFAQAIIDASLISTPVFSEQHTIFSPEDFYYLPLDSFDKIFLNILHDNTEENIINKELAKDQWEGDSYQIQFIGDSRFQITGKATEITQTAVFDNLAQTNLRELLKIAAPLTPMIQYPGGNAKIENIEDVIYRLLVIKGPPKEFATRYALFQNILKAYQDNHKIPLVYDQLELFFSDMMQNHEIEDKLMVDQSKTYKLIRQIIHMSNESVTQIPNCLITKIFYHYIPYKTFPSIEDIIKDPTSLAFALRDRMNESKEVIESYLGNRIEVVPQFHLLSETLNFSTFLALRPELVQIDEVFHSMIQTKQFNILIDDAFSVKEKIRKLIVNNISVLDPISHELREVCQRSSDPYQKLLDLISTMAKALEIIYFETGVSLDEDDKMPLRAIIFAYSNPIHLFSSIIFINEYCMGNNSPLYSVVSSVCNACHVTSTVLYLFKILDPKMTISSYLRSKNLFFNVAMCGFPIPLKNKWLKLLSGVESLDYTQISQLKVVLKKDPHDELIGNTSVFIYNTPEEMKQSLTKNPIQFHYTFIYVESVKQPVEFLTLTSYSRNILVNNNDVNLKKKNLSIWSTIKLPDDESDEYYYQIYNDVIHGRIGNQ